MCEWLKVFFGTSLLWIFAVQKYYINNKVLIYICVLDCVYWIYMFVGLKYTYTTSTESSCLVSPSTYVYTEVVDLNINVQNQF